MSWQLDAGRPVGADGAVTFSVWAPRAAALTVRLLGPDGGVARRAADGARGGRRLHGARRRRRVAPVGSDYVYPAARRRRAPRSGVAPPAGRRARAVAHRRARRVCAGATRAGAALPLADLVFYELHVGTFTPEGTFAGVAAQAPVPARPGRHRRRADAGRGLPRRAQLGLRRRLPVRAARRLRRARRAATAGRRLPRPRARADPRRRLQPPRAGGELPRRLRPVLHRPLPHPLGRRAQLRRARQRRGAPLLRRQRALLADRVPRRRPAPRRDPRHLRLRRAARPRGDRGRVPRRGGAARARAPG